MSNAYRSVLESGGVTPTGDAVATDVLAGKTFSNANAIGVTGTMVNRGAVNETIAPGESYTVPEGYHNGSGTVTASSISIISSGSEDATPLSLADLTVGKKYHLIVTGVNTSAQGSSPIIDSATGATYTSLGMVHSQSKNNYIAYAELIEFTATATSAEFTYTIGQIGYILF